MGTKKILQLTGALCLDGLSNTEEWLSDCVELEGLQNNWNFAF
jgi:hypothetical protein